MPPSPEPMAVPAAALPRARAAWASFDSAPNDMWLTMIGVPMTSGCFALGPMTVLVSTVSSRLSGRRASCAPLTRMSSQDTTGWRVRMGSTTDSPVRAMRWMSAIRVSSSSEERRKSSIDSRFGAGPAGGATGGGASSMRSNSDLAAPQTGQIQSMGRSSKKIPSVFSLYSYWQRRQRYLAMGFPARVS